MHIELPSEEATLALGARLARHVVAGAVIHLRGELGAGKTTLVRGLLRALGHEGKVKSPTYTLLEPYRIQGRRIIHIDLYRLAAPEEAEYLGLREEAGEAILLVEWPEKGEDVLPPPDLEVRLRYRKEGRAAVLRARTPKGEAWLAALGEDEKKR
ncbi:MAG: tRNA (adenosine(37)-N6)-threonylcarbamoyltransferase complex ATPase subunit type 1 TsaE [Gammaproteobacteria bacterium]|nr:MAG: tRNA (adenosine(37)-N6)-threonylcarbamoyltransferase complex ATPase subunit type 1 TsaE [Gammaproteobacteria bacterium]